MREEELDQWRRANRQSTRQKCNSDVWMCTDDNDDDDDDECGIGIGMIDEPPK